MDVAGREWIRLIRERPVLVAVSLMMAGVLACTDLRSPVDLEPDSLWSASLSPMASGPDPDSRLVTGQAAAVVQNGRTEAGIQLNGLDDSVGWGVFEGSCRDPGAVVGNADAYPAVSPDAPSAETILDVELSRAASYNVRAGSDPEGRSAIACGELTLEEEV